MAERFKRPVDTLRQQDNFGGREVGLNHPDQPLHVRLRDNGDIDIIAGDGVGMVMSMARRSITFFADQVKFLTREENGFRWNKYALNPKSVEYSQPALVPFEDTHAIDLYSGADYFTDSGA